MKKLFSLLLVSVIFISGCQPEQKKIPLSEPTPQILSTDEKRSAKIIQHIIFPGSEKEEELIVVRNEESALDILKRTHHLEIQTYSFGDIVNGVDGISGGKDGRYWIFYINGKQSDVGAGEYKVKDGDTIIWKLQKEKETL